MMRNLLIISLLFCLLISKAFGQAIPDEAKRYFDRGMVAIELAKSPADYESAIKEFRQAATLAPNWPEVFYNLGLVQEKAENYSDAVTSFTQYLKLAPAATDAGEVKSLISRIEYKNEILNKDKAKFQAVLGEWGMKPLENEAIYNTVFLTQNGEKIEYKTNRFGNFETHEVFFDGTNMKFKYRRYDLLAKEYEVIIKMVAPGRFEGVVNQVIFDTPHNDRRFDYLKGKKSSRTLIMVKQ